MLLQFRFGTGMLPVELNVGRIFFFFLYLLYILNEKSYNLLLLLMRIKLPSYSSKQEETRVVIAATESASILESSSVRS